MKLLRGKTNTVAYVIFYLPIVSTVQTVATIQILYNNNNSSTLRNLSNGSQTVIKTLQRLSRLHFNRKWGGIAARGVEMTAINTWCLTPSHSINNLKKMINITFKNVPPINVYNIFYLNQNAKIETYNIARCNIKCKILFDTPNI